jgi:hypothetical protein
LVFLLVAMETAQALARWISEPMTWAEICARYPDQWVCLVEMDRVHPAGFDFRTARVIGHGKTRREPVDQALAWRDDYKVIGHYFKGRITVRSPRPTVILDDETRDTFFGRRR